VPVGSDHLRVEFEVPGLSEAVALASELRVLAHGRVQIRPVSPRLLDRRWNVTLTIPSMAQGGPVRVVIVDDSAPFRRAARELLQRRGYLVVGEAGTAADALNAVEHFSPDALLLDLGLPDGCGFELATSLTHAQPNLAVLLTSANDPPAGKDRLRASGARGFVLKSCLAGAPLERFWRTPSP
jgi:CheY-like chemotaxis protein